MAGIPGELFNALRGALAQSEVLESNRSLRAFFQRESLSPWKNGIPEGYAPEARADLLIEYASGQNRSRGTGEHWYDGENVLVIFLAELWLYYQEEGKDMPDSIVEVFQSLPEVPRPALPR